MKISQLSKEYAQQKYSMQFPEAMKNGIEDFEAGREAKEMREVEFEVFLFDSKNSQNNGWKTGKGVFHQWGFSYEQIGESAGNFSVALVECTISENGLIEGKIYEVLPSKIKFI